MAARDSRPIGAKDYRRLPSTVRLDEMVVTIESNPSPDPEAGRNIDQHRALRDD
jgi:hypothetical protein